MQADRLLFWAAGTGIGLLGVHIIALTYSLYFLLPWLDVPMHFVGGVFSALVLIWFFFYSTYVGLSKSVSQILVVGILGALLVGSLWELFEFISGVPREGKYVIDTTIDLVMDVVGAALATTFILILKR